MAKPKNIDDPVDGPIGNPWESDLGEPTVTRVFDAPRETVFRAFIEPEQFVKFWGPAGTTVAPSSVMIEPWAGGRYESTAVADADATEYSMKCTFLTVAEPELLSYTDRASGIDSSMVFTDLGDGRTRTSLFHARRRP
ncbi:SRPBCC domain-containing protein [Streptomyces goshikiensis]|uniref:SRPBCC domain-containing protein n=1 Tax=Streptomyces goshikiensis TaxID=1942 RepID=UPI0036A48CBD